MPKYGFYSDAEEHFPRYLMYDISNVCNARCPFCPQSSIAKSNDFAPKHISWDHFEKTIEEAAVCGVELVRLTGDGEPLLHPKIFDMLAKCRELKINKVNLTTNGSLLKGKRLQALLDVSPQILDISLDAMRAETYAKYRVGLDFKTTVQNIHDFLDARDPSLTRVIVSMIAHPGLEEEIKEFQNYWTGKADVVAIRKLHSNLGAVDVGEGQAVSKKRWPCVHLWERLVVDFRGHIRFCPVDWYDKSFVGLVDDMTLYEAWHSEQLKQLRDNHLNEIFEKAGICSSCRDWASTPWNKSWLGLMKKL